ncbi:hypothetical protein BT69DRAFT_1349763 [Atractiella rhizophila]|nr:hypothetical protein BT69DRAFT_1349763 [Atractiella rhizophila]
MSISPSPAAQAPSRALLTLPVELLRLIFQVAIASSCEALSDPNSLSTTAPVFPDRSNLSLRLVNRFVCGLCTPFLYQTVSLPTPALVRNFLSIPNALALRGKVRNWVGIEGQNPLVPFKYVGTLVVLWKVDRVTNAQLDLLVDLFGKLSSVKHLVLGYQGETYDTYNQAIHKALAGWNLKTARLHVVGWQGLGLSWFTPEDLVDLPETWGETLEELAIQLSEVPRYASRMKKLKRLRILAQQPRWMEEANFQVLRQVIPTLQEVEIYWAWTKVTTQLKEDGLGLMHRNKWRIFTYNYFDGDKIIPLEEVSL